MSHPEPIDTTDPTRAPCPLCHGAGRFAFRAGDSFYAVTDYEADLYRCADCRCLFQWPLPDRDIIADFYPSGYWREDEVKTMLTVLQERYVRWMLRWDPMSWVNRLRLPRDSVFLDIGCSRGDWLALVREQGFTVRGIEADPRAVRYARHHYGLAVEQTEVDQWQAERGTCDAIAFFHLLEHLSDPRGFLGQCRLALKNGGRILVRVPNIDSWQWRFFGKRWKGLEIPRHLVLFTPGSLTHLLREQGFEIERFSTWSLRDGPPAIASSLLPGGEPTRQQVMGIARPLMTFAYLLLNWALTPVEGLAALCGKGSMITVVARKV